MPAVSITFPQPWPITRLRRSLTSFLASTASIAMRNIRVLKTCVGFRVRECATEDVKFASKRRIFGSRELDLLDFECVALDVLDFLVAAVEGLRG